jgi:hypothetical protein
MAKNGNAALQQFAAKRGNVPALKITVGIILILLFLLALMLQIQTSEAFILNGQAVGLSANWAILEQPFKLAQGNVSLNMAKAVMWGWGIECIYLVCVLGEVSIPRWRGLFMTGAFGLVMFDFWTDFNYGSLPSGMGGQIAFALVTSFIVAFFGAIGLEMVFKGITEMTH